MTRLAVLLVLALLALPASAQSRGRISIAPGATMTCLDVPISTPPTQTIRATDVGGGVVDVDIFVLASTATPVLAVTRSGSDLAVTLRVPEGWMSCTTHARMTGVPAGTFGVHLTTIQPTVTRTDVARTSVTVR